jgi:hypothetical protein
MFLGGCDGKPFEHGVAIKLMRSFRGGSYYLWLYWLSMDDRYIRCVSGPPEKQ